MSIPIFKRVPMPDSIREAINRKYGRLTVMAYVGKERDKYHVMCNCECGNQKVISFYAVRSGAVRSCGCLHREIAAERGRSNAKHGHTRNRSQTMAYRIWRGIITRCYDPHFKFFKYYGGRGIAVCDQWLGEHGFEQFFSDMGTPTPGMSLERKDNNQGYSPGNCIWIPKSDQSKNRLYNWQVLANGKVITAIEASKLLGRSKGFVDQRLRESGASKGVPVPIELI